MSDEAPRPKPTVRRFGARTYLLAAIFLFVLPAVGGGIAWLYGIKRDVERACTQPILELKGHAGCSVWPLAFSPDGRLAISGGDESIVRLWDLETGEMLREFKGHKRLRGNPDSRRMLFTDENNAIRLWDFETNEMIRKLGGQEHYIRFAVLGPDGRRVLSVDGGGMVRFWDLETGEVIREFEEHMRATAAAITPDGRRRA